MLPLLSVFPKRQSSPFAVICSASHPVSPVSKPSRRYVDKTGKATNPTVAPFTPPPYTFRPRPPSQLSLTPPLLPCCPSYLSLQPHFNLLPPFLILPPCVIHIPCLFTCPSLSFPSLFHSPISSLPIAPSSLHPYPRPVLSIQPPLDLSLSIFLYPIL